MAQTFLLVKNTNSGGMIRENHSYPLLRGTLTLTLEEPDKAESIMRLYSTGNSFTSVLLIFFKYLSS